MKEQAQRRGNAAWLKGMAAGILLAATVTGCVDNPGDTRGDLKQYSGPVKIKSLEQTRAEERSAASVVPVVQLHRTGYVALNDVAAAIGYHSQWLSGGRFGIGDHDVVWTARTGESAVQRAGRTIKLSAPAVRQGGKLYVPESGLPELFGDVAVFRSDGKQVSFYPKPPGNDAGADHTARAFGGPVSPYASESLRIQSTDGGSGNGSGMFNGNEGNQTDDRLIAEAKKYLGVKYEFGANPYPQSGTFDCSSFTQLVFGKFGLELPRTAREQGDMGSPEARDSLKRGDLLFFAIPGRFKTDQEAGHVGIYIGDGKMIHASTAGGLGVQITDLNSLAYWQDNFLFAKRLLP